MYVICVASTVLNTSVNCQSKKYSSVYHDVIPLWRSSMMQSRKKKYDQLRLTKFSIYCLDVHAWKNILSIVEKWRNIVAKQQKKIVHFIDFNMIFVLRFQFPTRIFSFVRSMFIRAFCPSICVTLPARLLVYKLSTRRSMDLDLYEFIVHPFKWNESRDWSGNG